MSSYRTVAVSLFGLWPAEGGRGEHCVISSPIKRYAKCAVAPPKNGRLSEQRSLVVGPGVAGKRCLVAGRGRFERSDQRLRGGGIGGRENTMCESVCVCVLGGQRFGRSGLDSVKKV